MHLLINAINIHALILTEAIGEILEKCASRNVR
nr:MAG TPA: hypothetical protein [Caudoviricetes sp.]